LKFFYWLCQLVKTNNLTPDIFIGLDFETSPNLGFKIALKLPHIFFSHKRNIYLTEVFGFIQQIHERNLFKTTKMLSFCETDWFAFKKIGFFLCVHLMDKASSTHFKPSEKLLHHQKKTYSLVKPFCVILQLL